MKTFVKRLSADIPLLTADALAWAAGAQASPQDVQMAEHPFIAKHREAMKPKMQMAGSIAIVPVQGVLAYNPGVDEMLWDGVEDSRSVLGMVQQASNSPDVQGILLAMDTPGGMMLGGPEIAQAVAQAKKSKPVIAHAGGVCASLGYMIASQATQVIANPSAIVGSIGVIASVADYTAFLDRVGVKIEYFTNADAKYKAAGALGTSLTDAQRENIQANVESAFGVFKGAVLACRPQVKPEAMQGQTFRGSEAKAVGLVDRLGSQDFALEVLRSYIK